MHSLKPCELLVGKVKKTQTQKRFIRESHAARLRTGFNRSRQASRSRHIQGIVVSLGGAGGAAIGIGPYAWIDYSLGVYEEPEAICRTRCLLTAPALLATIRSLARFLRTRRFAVMNALNAERFIVAVLPLW